MIKYELRITGECKQNPKQTLTNQNQASRWTKHLG